MTRRILPFLLLSLASICGAESSRLGMYLQGHRIGYSTYDSVDEVLNGRTVKRSNSKTVMNTEMLGTVLKMEITQSTWTDASGRPVRQTYFVESAGRSQKMDARFNKDKVTVNLDSSGTKSERVLDIPKGLPIVDDPIAMLLDNPGAVGAKKSFYVLDPTTVAFVKNQAVLKGPAKAKVRGKEVDSTLIEIIDPRATTLVFVSAKGDFIKAEAAMGIELLPEDGSTPIEKPSGKAPDLAFSTSIPTEPKLKNPGKLTRLKIRLDGVNLSGIPSDGHQTVKKDGNGWIMEIHPPKLADSPGVTIQQAGAQAKKWTGPDLHVPANDEKFRGLARQVIGDRKNVRDAALAIKAKVHSMMAANAGIGVLRDASEILETREGVCRDYAILTATLLRSAGIPTRFATGLVNWDGSFFYHAWVEVWDGKRWLGIDSTTADEQISASHIKLAHGTVGDVFTFGFLSNARIKVLETQGG